MYCSYCGAEIPDNARFCPACGRPCVSGTAGTGETSRHSEKKGRKAKRGGRNLRLLLALGLVLLVVALGIFFVVWWTNTTHYRTVTYESGAVYEGEVLKGEPDGYGTMDYSGDNSSDVAYYAGEWFSGSRNGEGVQVWKNGDEYSGDWWNDQMDGNGIMTYASGSVSQYEGRWNDGLWDGEGCMLWSNGDSFDGHWAEGVIHGPGVYTFADGTRLEGAWVDGWQQGEFHRYMPDGTTYLQIYEDNELISSELAEDESIDEAEEAEPDETGETDILPEETDILPEETAPPEDEPSDVEERHEDSDDEQTCSACSGSGNCRNCGGTGRVRRALIGTGEWVEQTCTYCRPSGSGNCSDCGGDGKR